MYIFMTKRSAEAMNHESYGHTNATPIHCTTGPASSHLVDLGILYLFVLAAHKDQT